MGKGCLEAAAIACFESRRGIIFVFLALQTNKETKNSHSTKHQPQTYQLNSQPTKRLMNSIQTTTRNQTRTIIFTSCSACDSLASLLPAETPAASLAEYSVDRSEEGASNICLERSARRARPSSAASLATRARVSLSAT